jgi:hypothetical protein
MIQGAQAAEIQPQVLGFQGFPLGENTDVPELLLKPQEMARCIDFKLNPGGQLETRAAVVKYTGAAVNEIHDIKSCIVSGTTRTLITDGDAVNGYKLYYINSTTATEIGSLEGAAKIVPYNNVALICDGEYLKYIDGITAVKQAYDDGTDGTFYDNYSGDQDSTTAISATGTGCTFTTPDWGNTLTIPPTRVFVHCQESGGTASITAQIIQANETAGTVDDTDVGDAGSPASITFEYDVTGFLLGDKLNITLPASATSEATTDSYEYTFAADYVEATLLTALNDDANWTGTLSGTFSVSATQLVFTYTANGAQADLGDAEIGYTLTMATKVFTGTVPSAAADFIEIIFDTVDNELVADTEYYCLIQGSNLNISHTTVTSGGALITTGSTPDTTKDPVMRVHPGLPPKATWGVVSNTRPFIYDPDYPGALYFGNLTHLDWSTTDGGGYITTIDNSRTSFAIGAAQDLYGELYVYGTQDQPFLCKLTGSSPSAYSLPLLFQKIWATSGTIENTGEDLWTASEDGVDALSGVQEYGDLRTFSASDPVKNQLADYWTSSAFTGYNPPDGQLWLYMPGSSYVNVCHVKQAIRDQAGQTRYPWTRYDLPATPTCFSQTTLGFLIGSSDGFVYKLDSDEYKDLTTTHIHPEFKTPRIDMPGRYYNFIKAQVLCQSATGSTMDMDIYINGDNTTSINTYSIYFPVNNAVTVGELTMDVDDIEFSLETETNPMYSDLNFNCYAIQIEISNVTISGEPVYFNGLALTYRALEQ